MSFKRKKSRELLLGFVLDVSSKRIEATKEVCVGIIKSLESGDIFFLADDEINTSHRRGQMVGIISDYRRTSDFFLKDTLKRSFKFMSSADGSYLKHLVVISDNCSEFDIHSVERALKRDVYRETFVTFIGLGNCYPGLGDLSGIYGNFNFILLENVDDLLKTISENMKSIEVLAKNHTEPSFDFIEIGDFENEWG